MKFAPRHRLPAVFLAAALLLSPSAATAGGTLRVGVLFPVSGERAPASAELLDAVLLAAEAIQRGWAQGGWRLEVVSRSCDDTPDSAILAARFLVAEGVGILLAPLLPESAVAVAGEVSIPGGVPLFVCSPALPDLATMDDEGLVFTFSFSAGFEGQALAAAAEIVAPGRPAGILYANDPTGRGISRAFRSRSTPGGAAVPPTIPFVRGQRSYRAELDKVLAGDPGLVVLAAWPADGERILQQARERRPEPPILLTGTLQDSSTRRLLAAAGFAAILGVGPELPPGADLDVLRETYRRSRGADRGEFTSVVAADALALAALAFLSAGGTTAGEPFSAAVAAVANPPGAAAGYGTLAGAMEQVTRGEDVDYRGMSGSLDLDAAGNRLGVSFTLRRLVDGAWIDERSLPAGATPSPTGER